jgi:hypothetical protein
VRQTLTPTSGQPRAAHAWRDNSANQFIAVGTYRKLYAYDTSLAQNDVTPFRRQVTLATNPIATQSSSPILVISDTGHGAGVGDTVVVAGAATFAGITLAGAYVITAVGDRAGLAPLDKYQVNAGSNANATTTGGGASVTAKYEITVGTELGGQGNGFGIGQFGMGNFGDPRSGQGIFIEPRVWSLDHFGQVLLGTYNIGAIYQFDPTQNQPWPRATLASNDAQAPTDCRYMFVTQERFVVALRTGMIVQWCSQGDYSTWTPSATNTANSRTLTVGTKLVAGRVLGPFLSMIWSDSAAYLMQWTGSLYVYNTSILATECGLVSPGAAVTVNGVAYWMGFDARSTASNRTSRTRQATSRSRCRPTTGWATPRRRTARSRPFRPATSSSTGARADAI